MSTTRSEVQASSLELSISSCHWQRTDAGRRHCFAKGLPSARFRSAGHEVRPFSEKQIGLLETFADQAVIAIENVRLFQELQERTRELARSVEELKALGEVGQAVSSTLDLQTVLEHHRRPGGPAVRN